MSRMFDGVHDYEFIEHNYKKNLPLKLNEKLVTFDELKNKIDFKDGMSISFHHHLRNGDYVANMLFEIIEDLDLKDITILASSIFPTHAKMVDLIKNHNITKIYAGYISGPVADCISEGYLKEPVIMHSHGARSRILLNKEVELDLAFIASPCVDQASNLNGSEGPSSCGLLGYVYGDAVVAKQTVAITDYIVDKVEDIEITGANIDYVVKVDQIGDPAGIVSGTTQITKDPIGLIIARNTNEVIKHSGLLKDGMSFQTGAGGISLAVTKFLKETMIERDIKGSFASGGITGYLVDMFENNLFEKLWDVQCFDLDAVASIKRNKHHLKMSASQYANPYDKENKVKDLDVVILGATEIDLNFNVNVTTRSNGVIMGGSGGHCDTAAGAKLAIIVSKLVSKRISVVRDRVTALTTPGETVDVLVTDHGVAINPKHQELIKTLKEKTNLKILTIEELYEKALSLTGKPKDIRSELEKQEIVGIIEYRDGSILDYLYKAK